MKKIIMTVSILLANLVLADHSNACSIDPYGIAWPIDGDKNVPLNTNIVEGCYGDCDYYNYSITLHDKSRQKEVPLIELGKKDIFSDVWNYNYLVPSTKLSPATEYNLSIKDEYGELALLTFTTSNSEDINPPTINKDAMTTTIEWIGDKEEAEYFDGGMCFPLEYSKEAIIKYGMESQISSEDYLPEHYHISFDLEGISDETDNIIYNVFEVDEQENETFVAGYNYKKIKLDRLVGITSPTDKKYRIKVKDILGNESTEALDIVVTLNKSDSKYSISGGIDGGGDGGKGRDTEPAAGGGCSLSAKSDAKSADIVVIAIILGLLLAISFRRKKIDCCVK